MKVIVGVVEGIGDESTSSDSESNNETNEKEGNLNDRNDTEFSQQNVMTDVDINKSSLRMIYPSMSNNQRMPHVIMDASSMGSLGTIVSLPSSKRKY